MYTHSQGPTNLKEIIGQGIMWFAVCMMERTMHNTYGIKL